MIFKYQNLNWRDKPQQWGNFDSVQGNLFEQAAKIGIDPAKIELAMPMWNPGDQRDYSKNGLIGTNYGATYEKNSLNFDGVNDHVHYSDNIISSLSDSTTIMYLSPAADKYCHLSLVTNTTSTDNFAGFYLATINKVGIHVKSIGAWLISAKSPDNSFSTGKPFMVTGQFGSQGNKIFVNEEQKSLTYSAGDSSITAGYNSPTHNAYDIGMRNIVGTTYDTYYNGLFDYIIICSQLLTSDHIAFLSDNPYYLWSPYSSVFHSLPTPGSTLLPS